MESFDSPAESCQNRIACFARLFELQHYCQILHQRHSAVLAKHVGRVNGVIASFLEVKAPTIRRDLRLIRSRLRAKWDQL